MGAFIAFITVIWQIRSSSKHVEDQIKAQRDAEREGQARQKRAIATAILFEIDCFRTIELDYVERHLAHCGGASDAFPTAAGLRTNLSQIYKGVSPLLGSLNAKSVSAIVSFYSLVGTYEGLWRDYAYYLDILRAPVNPTVHLRPQDLASEAKRQLESIRGFIPRLRTLAGDVINSVAHDCGLEELIEKSDAQTH